MEKEQAGITIENIYAKSKNEYFDFNKIDDKYIPNKVKSKKFRSIMIFKKINNKYIGFYLTSKSKKRIHATYWPNSGVNNIDQWISYQPLIFEENEIKMHNYLWIPENIKIRHINNLKRFSGDTNRNSYYKHLLRAIEIAQKN